MSFYLTRKGKKTVKKTIVATILLFVGISLFFIGDSFVSTRKKQKQEIEAFIKRTQDRPPEESSVILEELEKLPNQHIFDSSRREAENVAIEKIKSEIVNRYKKFNYTEKSYRSMLELAKQICSTAEAQKNGQLYKSSLYTFAKTYIQLMDAAQNGSCLLNITRIEVFSKYDDGAYIEDCYITVNSKRLNQLVSEGRFDCSFGSKWTPLPEFNPPINGIACRPWDTLAFPMYVWEVNKSVFSISGRKNKGRKNPSFIPAKKFSGVREVEVTGHVMMRVFYALNYKSIDELYSTYLM